LDDNNRFFIFTLKLVLLNHEDKIKVIAYFFNNIIVLFFEKTENIDLELFQVLNLDEKSQINEFDSHFQIHGVESVLTF